MTRAVIKLSGDISSAMPDLCQRIEGCAYNPQSKLLSFRFQSLSIVVEAESISIYKIEDEAMVKIFMDWFKSLLNTAGEEKGA
jgi:hypothetical protein